MVHHQRDVGVGLAGRFNQMLDEGLARVFASTGAGLQNNWRTHFFGGLHDGLNLLQVVDVECRNTIAVDCRVVQQFAH